jgi:hypothetical protein
MVLVQHAPETDLWLRLPDDADRIDPHTIHTHYFGFTVPEAALGGFISLVACSCS